jgi:hypothetical protein
MDRVVRFAQSINVSKLWIDKECIYQRPEDRHSFPEDKEHGVQIMDVVYGDSPFSVGLLTVELAHQHEVDLLSKLLQGRLLVDPKNKDSPELRPKVQVTAVYMLILRILSDPRWSRGWIFQEDHLASDRMILLIPCHQYIRKGHDYKFGDIVGELQVRLRDFREAVTMFCMAVPDQQGRWPNTEILGKAKQYNICNKTYMSSSTTQDSYFQDFWGDDTSDDSLDTETSVSNVLAYSTTTNSVLDDICNRLLEYEEDRIAILANALRFTKRLNNAPGSLLLDSGQYSLSVALLALVLMNGEILASSARKQFASVYLPKESNLMRYTLQSYLKACQHCFAVPHLRFQQSFVDRCRFKSPDITIRGIETTGWLFTLLPRRPSRGQADEHCSLFLTNSDRRALSGMSGGPRFGRSKLSKNAHRALGLVIQKLELLWPRSKLASYMQEHLLLDKQQGGSISRAKSYVLDMMSVLYQALHKGQEVRLARLASTHPDAEPNAIFIAPEPDGWIVEHLDNAKQDGKPILANIFTSWDKAQNSYNKDRVVSLQIDIKDDKGARQDWDERSCYMESLGWVQGVWCVVGEKMANYVFPLAGITDYQVFKDRSISHGGRKRKRSDDI